MVKIIDVRQTMRAPGLYRVAKDYVIKERVNVNPYKGGSHRAPDGILAVCSFEV